MQNETAELQRIIDEAENIVFFGGAGVSTESGIPDFRGADGLYNQKKQEYDAPPEVILSHSYFFSHTEEFFRFYRDKMMTDAKPNDAHRALAALEAAGKLSCVITQNIDNLHQAAGSRNVLELHGSAHRNFCVNCEKFYPFSYIRESDNVPTCSCGGIIKPDVVLYGEALDAVVCREAERAISGCDVLIVAGTSLTVYPAAGMLQYFRGRYLVLINRDATPADSKANLVIRASVGETLRQIKI